MPTFTCHQCALSTKVPGAAAGKRVKCPNCGAAGRIAAIASRVDAPKMEAVEPEWMKEEEAVAVEQVESIEDRQLQAMRNIKFELTWIRQRIAWAIAWLIILVISVCVTCANVGVFKSDVWYHNYQIREALRR